MIYVWIAFGVGVVLFIAALTTESPALLVAGFAAVLGAFGYAVFVSEQEDNQAWELFAAECNVGHYAHPDHIAG